MNYFLAKKEIEKIYKITELSNDVLQIHTTDLVDNFSYIYIALISKNNEAYLTDFANNLEEINLDEKNIKKIINKYNIEFNNWHLECKYNNLNDIKNYINCLKEIIKTPN